MRWGLAMLLCLALPAAAGDVVFYRCTDASGALTVQNMPCPKGTQQSTRVMQAVGTPPPMPVPAAAPMPAASQAVQATWRRGVPERNAGTPGALRGDAGHRPGRQPAHRRR
jgi:hypothetical protein